MSKWHTTEFCESCYKEFCCTSECKYHLLHRVEQLRDEIETYYKNTTDEKQKIAFNSCLMIIDNLIEVEHAYDE